MNISKPFEHFARIERAYLTALDGRDGELVSAIRFAAGDPRSGAGATPKEIAEALRWSARKDLREADRLERTWRK
jgi:hypothetical protein